jgi:hypothetical protein
MGPAQTPDRAEYEVLVHKDGRWQVDCRLRHRDQALEEAHALARRSDVEAVKVVEERPDPDSGTPQEKVVLDTSRSRQPRPARRDQAPAAAPAPRPSPEPGTAPPPRRDWTAPVLGGIAVMALLGIALVVLG